MNRCQIDVYSFWNVFCDEMTFAHVCNLNMKKNE